MKFEIYNEDSQNILFQVLPNIKNPIIVTDPPFNIGYHYNTYKDNLSEEEYLEGLCSLLEYCPSVVIHYPESLYKISFQLNKFPQKIVSWVYNSCLPRQHRDIAFFDIKPNFNQVKQPYKNQNDKRIKERIKNGCKRCKTL